MNAIKVLKISILFLLLSLSLAFSSSIFAAKQACYYCRDNTCAGATGSGWTHCMVGFEDCALGGSSCSSGGGV